MQLLENKSYKEICVSYEVPTKMGEDINTDFSSPFV